MAGRTPGRRSKLTRDLESRLLHLVRYGVPLEVACHGAGVEGRTIRIWRRRAAEGDKRFAEVCMKIDKARAEVQANMLVQIRAHGKKDWRALAWVLERAFGEHFGFKARMSMTLDAELEKMLNVAEQVLGRSAATKLLEALTAEGGESETGGTAGERHLRVVGEP